jgi:hypothetical protein
LAAAAAAAAASTDNATVQWATLLQVLQKQQSLKPSKMMSSIQHSTRWKWKSGRDYCRSLEP